MAVVMAGFVHHLVPETESSEKLTADEKWLGHIGAIKYSSHYAHIGDFYMWPVD